jgi:hypothetical protein
MWRWRQAQEFFFATHPWPTPHIGPQPKADSAIEYRNGNEKENSVRNLTGLDHVGNAVLKRGVIGSVRIFESLRPGAARSRRA